MGFSMPARLLLFGLLAIASHAHAQWALVQADAPARAIHDTSRYVPQSGQRFALNDMIETSAQGGLQLQDPEGNVVALGADTQVMLTRDAHVVLLRGWLKVLHTCTGARPRCAIPAIDTVRLRYTPANGSAAVIAASPAGYPQADAVFVESGTLTLLSLAPAYGSKVAPAQLPMHQFAVWRAASPALVVTPSPDPAFVAAMPVAFRDALTALPLPAAPTSAATAAAAQEKPLPVDYDDIADWLNSPLAIRTQPGTRFTERFRTRLADPAFRRAIDQHLGTLPEWRALLYPPPAPPHHATAAPSVYRSLSNRP
ncbi:hypothetical protein GCM10027093_65480 [Paraburkholderia jirisanensis]